MDNIDKNFIQNFSKDNLECWKEMFDAIDLFTGFTEEYICSIYKNLDLNYKFNKILKQSLSRIFRTFNEIVLLSRHGFIEAAKARWRTLYETILVLIVILESGDREKCSNTYINNQKKVDAKFLRKFIEISEKENSNWDKIHIDKSSLTEENLEVYEMATSKETIKFENYPFQKLNSLGDIIKEFSPEDYKIDYYVSNWCIHSGNYRSLDLLEYICGKENIITTKYGVDEVIGSTLSILFFCFKKINSELFEDNSDINNNLNKLQYLNNNIVDCIAKLREKIYNYAD